MKRPSPASCMLITVLLLQSFSYRSFAKGEIGSEKDVIYGHNMNVNGQDQQLGLDIYWPANAAKGKKYPFVLLIHGGSFLTGRKEGLGDACQILADSGFVAATLDYRMGWNRNGGHALCDADIPGLEKAVYRANQDTRAALRYLMDNADKYHIDKNWVFIGGNSAGGATALDVLYVTQADADKSNATIAKELGKLDDATNSSKTTYKIAGMCNMWGGLFDSTLVTSSNAVPTIFFHGTGDKTVPYDKGVWGSKCPNAPALYGSACLYRRIQAYGKPGQLNLIIGGKHGPTEYTHTQLMSNTACFFHSVMRGDAHSGEYTDVVAGCR